MPSFTNPMTLATMAGMTVAMMFVLNQTKGTTIGRTILQTGASSGGANVTPLRGRTVTV